MTERLPAFGDSGPVGVTDRAGEGTRPIAFVRGRPRLASGFGAAHESLRRYAELAPIAAVPPGREGRRVQYWSFADVAREQDRETVDRLPVSYDVTVISPRPMGWERPKTHGHVHVRPGARGAGFPEVYQVLEGRAGFLVQDLVPGPASTLVVLVEARAGETVVIPPLLHHVTISLGEDYLVTADAVCRASSDEYGGLSAAHGMAYFIATDGRVRRNPAYRSAPALVRVDAQAWSEPIGADLYGILVRAPDRLAWLCYPDAFAARFPALRERTRAVVSQSALGR